KTITTFCAPRNDDSETSLPSWSLSVKSGASWPVSTGTGAPLRDENPVSLGGRFGRPETPPDAALQFDSSRRRRRRVARADDLAGVVGLEGPHAALRPLAVGRDVDARGGVVVEQHGKDVSVHAHQ